MANPSWFGPSRHSCHVCTLCCQSPHEIPYTYSVSICPSHSCASHVHDLLSKHYSFVIVNKHVSTMSVGSRDRFEFNFKKAKLVNFLNFSLGAKIGSGNQGLNQVLAPWNQFERCTSSAFKIAMFNSCTYSRMSLECIYNVTGRCIRASIHTHSRWWAWRRATTISTYTTHNTHMLFLFILSPHTIRVWTHEQYQMWSNVFEFVYLIYCLHPCLGWWLNEKWTCLRHTHTGPELAHNERKISCNDHPVRRRK
jgi:hypothetical protein